MTMKMKQPMNIKIFLSNLFKDLFINIIKDIPEIYFTLFSI